MIKLEFFAGTFAFWFTGDSDGRTANTAERKPWLDEGPEFSYLEARLYHHKTAGRAKVGRRLLPVACPVPGVSRERWASSWLYHRELQGLVAGVGKPTMPAPLHNGGWSTLPLGPSDAATWLREILSGAGFAEEIQSVGTHSAKATVLSWMCKAHAAGALLHFVEGMLLAIYSGLFAPDETRAGRWKGCRSLEQALDCLAKRSNPDLLAAEEQEEHLQHEEEPSSFGDSWALPKFRADLEASFGPDVLEADALDDEPDVLDIPSSASEGRSEDDHELDDRHLDYAGKAVSGLLASSGELGHRVFRHRVSGIFHIMAAESAPDFDGEMSSTKCGKLISHNFEEVGQHECFLPAKCKRCFTQ